MYTFVVERPARVWIENDHSAFRIRIRSDPYHLVGSGSVSGNVDMDPGSAKNKGGLQDPKGYAPDPGFGWAPILSLEAAEVRPPEPDQGRRVGRPSPAQG